MKQPNISPVQVHPKANYLHVQLGAFKNGLPAVNWAVGFLVPGKDAIPAVGVPGHLNFVPETPAVPDVLSTHASGTYDMTQSDWDNWTTQNDDAYVFSLVAKALNYSVL